MANILFWNLNEARLDNLIARACHANDIDILILAEFKGNMFDLLAEINLIGGRVYLNEPMITCRVNVISRYPIGSFSKLFESRYVVIHNFVPPVGGQLLLTSVHMPSKLNQDELSQYSIATRVSREIKERELAVGHRNSIVVGDLNSNPFEPALIAHDAFHAVMDKSIANKISRVFLGDTKDFFYNPMWSKFGDENPGPSGTYYHGKGHHSYFWNMFDQILLRPTLLPYYDNTKLKVITEIDGQNLLKNGYIDDDFSDHLPIMCSLELERMP